MGKKSRKRKIILEFDDKDAFAIWEYQKFIIKHLKAGDRIPTRVLNKFFSFIKVESASVKEGFNERLSHLKAELLVKYLKIYNFEKISNSHRTYQPKYSFNGLIDHIFSTISFEIYIEQDKKKILIHLFDIIESYFDSYQGNTLKLFRKYKRDVLIGEILFALGFDMLKNKIIPNAADFSEAIKNTTKALLKKRKKMLPEKYLHIKDF